MPKITYRIRCLLCIFLVASLSSSFADTLRPAPHVIDARRLVKGIQPSDNSYSLRHRVVRWKNRDGSGRYICHSDCVGFIDSLLMYSYCLRPYQFGQLIGKERPTARFMEQDIASGRGFKTVSIIQDVIPGDIIGVAFPLGSKANGHMMMIDDFPKLRENTPPLIEGTHQWAVRIIDCTGSGHGTDDTRYIGHKDGRAQFRHGVGRGVIRLYTDRNGHVVGYTWSVGPNAKFKSCTIYPISIGRFQIR